VGWTFDLAIGYALAVHTIMRARVRASSVECLGRLRDHSNSLAFHNSNNSSNNNNNNNNSNNTNHNLTVVLVGYLVG